MDEITIEVFDINSDEDEIRVDGLCRGLLQDFHRHLLERGTLPGEASSLASSADYFVRDFVVSIKRRNIFEERPGIVRQFAGNWYIANTLEPDVKELSTHLAGVRTFYRYLHHRRLIAPPFLSAIEKECEEIAYYRDRIDSFWKISGDGFIAWERECTLKES